MTTVTIERRKRGVFGWFFALCFWGFNALMALWIYAGISQAAKHASANQYEQAGYQIGTGVGVFALLVLWVIGAVILGLMMFFTRGKKMLITKEQS